MPFRGAVLGFVVLAVARHDLWWWDDRTRVLGLPVGLTYHVLFCLAVAAFMAVVVRRDRFDAGDGGAPP